MPRQRLNSSSAPAGSAEAIVDSDLLIAAGIMTGLACFFGFVLAAANRWLRVDEDPRVEQVEGLLPGTNCGACGQPGCRGFAEALVLGKVTPGGCTVSTADGVRGIAEFLGVDVGLHERRVARLHCAGGKSSVRMVANYRGPSSCRAAHLVSGGGRACPWGCLGLGDCDTACSFGAIHMNDEALPVVAVDLCTACNDCVDVCPLDLFTLEPIANQLLVQCRNPMTGEAARAVCHVACDACGRCALDAPEGAVVMAGGLPYVHEPQNTDEGATARCPTGAIRWVVGDQFGATPALLDIEEVIARE